MTPPPTRRVPDPGRLPDLPCSPEGTLELCPGWDRFYPLLWLARLLAAGGVLCALGDQVSRFQGLHVRVFGIASVVLLAGMVLLLASCAAVVYGPRYRLRLTPAGLSFGNLRGRAEYSWEDVQEFGILAAGDDAYVGFVLRTGREAPGGVAGAPYCIFDTYRMSAPRLRALLESWWARQAPAATRAREGMPSHPAFAANDRSFEPPPDASPAAPMRAPLIPRPGRLTLRGWCLGVAVLLGVPVLLPAAVLLEARLRDDPVPPLLPGLWFLASSVGLVLTLAIFPRRFRAVWHRPREEPRVGKTTGGRPTRVLYDVADDRPFRPHEFRLLLVAIPGFFAMMTIAGLVHQSPSGAAVMGGTAAFLLIPTWLLVQGFGEVRRTRTWFRDQAHCREGLRTGEYEVAEGVLTGYRWRKNQDGELNAGPPPAGAERGGNAVVVFQVGDMPFVVESAPDYGGFSADGVQGTDDLAAVLPEGTLVRFSHRDGRILRIEIIDAFPAAPQPLPAADRPAARRESVSVPAEEDAYAKPTRLARFLTGFAFACGGVSFGRLLLIRRDWMRYDELWSDWPAAAALGACAVLLLTDRLREALRRRPVGAAWRNPPALRTARVGLNLLAAGLAAVTIVTMATTPRSVIACSAALSPDGRLLAVGGSDGRILLCDPVSIRAVTEFNVDAEHEVRGLAWSPDGRFLLANSQDRQSRHSLCLIDVASGDTLWTRPTRGGSSSRAVAWSSQGGAVAWADSWAGEAIVANSLTGAPEFTLPVSQAESVAFSPDGRLLAVGGQERVLIADAGSGKELFALPGHPAGVGCLAWSPDGTRLAAGGRAPKKTAGKGDPPGDLRLWDVRHQSLLAVMPELQPGEIRDVSFSADGRRLVSVSRSTVTVWDGLSGRELASHRLPTSGSLSRGVAWLPDGRVAAAFGDIVAWDPASGAEARRVRLIHP